MEERGSAVLAGPFAGLVYPESCLPDVDAPVAKLVGSYEEELHAIFALAIRSRPSSFVDIGCAEGYYAVGFAKASPPTTVFAYETSRSARALCAEFAEANGVAARVSISGRATDRSLQALPLAPSVVLSDCEGAEAAIFTEPATRRLSSALLVIELHDWIAPEAEALLRRRLARTHSCELVMPSARDPQGYPSLAGWTAAERALALNEWPGRAVRLSRWAIFRPRNA